MIQRPNYYKEFKIKKKILIAIFSMSVLASCSKKPSEEYDVSAKSDQSDALAIENPTDESSNTTPLSKQKPETILDQNPNPVESTRRMVREAQVNFTVKDVVKSTLAIEKMTI